MHFFEIIFVQHRFISGRNIWFIVNVILARMVFVAFTVK